MMLKFLVGPHWLRRSLHLCLVLFMRMLAFTLSKDTAQGDGVARTCQQPDGSPREIGRHGALTTC
jgi:hypothetical protein